MQLKRNLKSKAGLYVHLENKVKILKLKLKLVCPKSNMVVLPVTPESVEADHQSNISRLEFCETLEWFCKFENGDTDG